MLAVMWGHLSTFGSTFLYSFHMPVFFILSGLFFKNKETKDLLRGDFCRLVLPYLITCFLIIVLTLLFGGNFSRQLLAAFWGTGSSMNTAKYFSNIPNIGAIWFLLALVWSRLLFNIIIKLKNDIGVFLLICAIFIAASLVGRYIIVLPFSFLSGLCSLPFLFYGYYSKRHNINIYIQFAFIAVWVICIAYSHMNIARCYFKYYLIDVIGGIGGYIVFVNISSLLKRVVIVKKILSFIGRNSIVYLCFHLIMNMFFHLHINTILFFAVEITACTIIVWLLSLFKVTKGVFKVSLNS